MLRTHYSSHITQKMAGETVVVAGWVQKIRDIGKVKFVVMRDREGEIQITAKKGDTPESVFSVISELTRESVISVKGRVESAKNTPNSVEIMPTEMTLLAKAEVP